MTQVSRIPLRKEIEKRMFEVFLESIAMVQSPSKVDIFVQDLLSVTERVMLAKRLSIALLLAKGYHQRSVAKLLRVGLGTVNKVSDALQHGTGGYEQMTKIFMKQEKQVAFWQRVDDIMADLLPPGHRNWSTWRKERYLEKLKVKKPY